MVREKSSKRAKEKSEKSKREIIEELNVKKFLLNWLNFNACTAPALYLPESLIKSDDALNFIEFLSLYRIINNKAKQNVFNCALFTDKLEMKKLGNKVCILRTLKKALI